MCLSAGQILPVSWYNTDNVIGKTIWWGFPGLHNTWIIGHYVAGSGIAWLINNRNIIYLNPEYTILWAGVIGVVFEVGEAWAEDTFSTQGKIDIYGSVERYWYDTCGDVVAVMFGAMMSSRYLPKSARKDNKYEKINVGYNPVGGNIVLSITF